MWSVFCSSGLMNDALRCILCMDSESSKSLKRQIEGLIDHVRRVTPPPAPEQDCTVQINVVRTHLKCCLVEDDVMDLFKERGDIRRVDMLSNGGARVVFERKESTRRACELDGRLLEDIQPNHTAQLSVMMVRNVIGHSPTPSGIMLQGHQLSGKVLAARLELSDSFFVGEPSFDVTRRLLGLNQSNMQHIMAEAKNLVDIHIKGQASARVCPDKQLMIVVKSTNAMSFNTALSLVHDLANTVQRQLVDWHARHNPHFPSITPTYNIRDVL